MFKAILSVVALTSAALLMPAEALAGEVYQAEGGRGNLGLGLEFGQPGTWGATGKFWLDSANAFQPAVKFNGGGAVVLQLDYLWHNFDIVHMRDMRGTMPVYIGLGGNLLLQNAAEIAARVPLGISYIFDRSMAPVDIYFQVVPTLWFFTGGGTVLYGYAEFGAHYYF